MEEASIETLRQYIQIESVSNATDYQGCVRFLRAQAESIGLECEVVEVKTDRPVVVMKWPGTKPSLPAVLLNSHMDVVPVEADKWTYPPFAAHVDEHGRIFGRGTQDMKSVGIQHLEAVRRLRREGVALARTVVLTFVPEEETGGLDGMKLFVQTQAFKELNIGFALDEGLASPQAGHFLLFHGEKHKWSVRFHLTGDVGHGCQILPNTAAEKLARLLKSIYDFRAEQFALAGGRTLTPDVPSINVTMLQGGIQNNVIPSEIIIECDIRLPPNTNSEAWKATMNGWCADAGDGVWIEELLCEMLDKPTRLDETNPYYQPIVDVIRKLNYNVLPVIADGISDMRYLRNLGIPAFGLTPFVGPLLIHQHDEFITKKDFLFGINAFCEILQGTDHIVECS